MKLQLVSVVMSRENGLLETDVLACGYLCTICLYSCVFVISAHLVQGIAETDEGTRSSMKT